MTVSPNQIIIIIIIIIVTYLVFIYNEMNIKLINFMQMKLD